MLGGWFANICFHVAQAGLELAVYSRMISSSPSSHPRQLSSRNAGMCGLWGAGDQVQHSTMLSKHSTETYPTVSSLSFLPSRYRPLSHSGHLQSSPIFLKDSPSEYRSIFEVSMGLALLSGMTDELWVGF